MNVFNIYKIKDEPYDKGPPAVAQNADSSDNRITFMLDNEYKLECLDEVDGRFKYFSELNCTEVPEAPGDDCKNLCNKCNKQFNNMLAYQNHYIFSHPCPSMLTKSEIGSCNRLSKIKYNWLDESVQGKEIPRKIKPAFPHITKMYPKGHLEKLAILEKKIKIAEAPVEQSPGFTLENIKCHPQDGIRVVKKSDINFDRLRMQAEQKIFSENLELRSPEADNTKVIKKTSKPDCVLFVKQVETTLLKKQKSGMKYLCRQCNTKMFDAYDFDIHMQQHLDTTFTCPLCTETFCTEIGITKHSESCV